ncbi:hypothetical protein ACOME3_009719 [Neoechinorhynchus agilis]
MEECFVLRIVFIPVGSDVDFISSVLHHLLFSISTLLNDLQLKWMGGRSSSSSRKFQIHWLKLRLPKQSTEWAVLNCNDFDIDVFIEDIIEDKISTDWNILGSVIVNGLLHCDWTSNPKKMDLPVSKANCKPIKMCHGNGSSPFIFDASTSNYIFIIGKFSDYIYEKIRLSQSAYDILTHLLVGNNCDPVGIHGVINLVNVHRLCISLLTAFESCDMSKIMAKTKAAFSLFSGELINCSNAYLKGGERLEHPTDRILYSSAMISKLPMLRHFVAGMDNFQARVRVYYKGSTWEFRSNRFGSLDGLFETNKNLSKCTELLVGEDSHGLHRCECLRPIMMGTLSPIKSSDDFPIGVRLATLKGHKYKLSVFIEYISPLHMCIIYPCVPSSDESKFERFRPSTRNAVKVTKMDASLNSGSPLHYRLQCDTVRVLALEKLKNRMMAKVNCSPQMTRVKRLCKIFELDENSIQKLDSSEILDILRVKYDRLIRDIITDKPTVEWICDRLLNAINTEDASHLIDVIITADRVLGDIHIDIRMQMEENIDKIQLKRMIKVQIKIAWNIGRRCYSDHRHMSYNLVFEMANLLRHYKLTFQSNQFDLIDEQIIRSVPRDDFTDNFLLEVRHPCVQFKKLDHRNEAVKNAELSTIVRSDNNTQPNSEKVAKNVIFDAKVKESMKNYFVASLFRRTRIQEFPLCRRLIVRNKVKVGAIQHCRQSPKLPRVYQSRKNQLVNSTIRKTNIK